MLTNYAPTMHGVEWERLISTQGTQAPGTCESPAKAIKATGSHWQVLNVRVKWRDTGSSELQRIDEQRPRKGEKDRRNFQCESSKSRCIRLCMGTLSLGTLDSAGTGPGQDQKLLFERAGSLNLVFWERETKSLDQERCQIFPILM